MVITVSPHTRGSTSRAEHGLGADEGFPAHAGIDLDLERLGLDLTRFPRTRGDRPLLDKRIKNLEKVSPHTRGSTALGQYPTLPPAGFPAHAGIDLGTTTFTWWLLGFPRTRGDRPELACEGCLVSRVSPHTRGYTITSASKG